MCDITSRNKAVCASVGGLGSSCRVVIYGGRDRGIDMYLWLSRFRRKKIKIKINCSRMWEYINNDYLCYLGGSWFSYRATLFEKR